MKNTFHFMSKFSVIALISSLLLACTSQEISSKKNEKARLPTGVSLIENVVATENRLAIPFKKYTLNNGLTVIFLTVTHHVRNTKQKPCHQQITNKFQQDTTIQGMH